MFPLPQQFKNGFNGTASTTYPIVVIASPLPSGEINFEADNAIFLSRKPGSIGLTSSSQALVPFFEDYGLEISDISETLNIMDRKFMTNDVTVEVSNYVIKNKRFTDRFTGEFTGLKCQIYYANEACSYLEDCALVFEGYIRDYTANHEKVSFTIEDESSYIVEGNSIPRRKTPNPDLETIENNIAKNNKGDRWIY